MKRVLSWKRLLIVIAVFALLTGGTYAVHAVQSRRQSSGIKDQADRAAAGAEPDAQMRDQAIDLYEKYLRFKPRDEDAFRSYTALLFARARSAQTGATYSEATKVGEKFLREFPDHPAERRALVDLYMKRDDIRLALDHLRKLLDPKGTNTEDIELLRKAAVCEAASGDATKAVEYLQTALKTGKAPLGVYEELIALYWQNRTQIRDGSGQANELARILIETEPFKSDVAAQVVAVQYRLDSGDYASAQKQLKLIFTEMPGGQKSPEANLAAARLDVIEITTPESVAIQLKKANAHLEAALAQSPKDIRAGLFQAEILDRMGKTDEAVNRLCKTAEALGEPGAEYVLVVDRLIDFGNRDRSAELVERIAKVDTIFFRIMAGYFRGRLALLRKDWTQARSLLETASTALSPPAWKDYHKKAKAGLGKCYEIFQNPDEQLRCYSAALADDPRYFPAIIGQAEALAKLGRIEDALTGDGKVGRPGFREIVGAYKQEKYRATLVRLELLQALKVPTATSWAAFDASLGPLPPDRLPEVQLLWIESLAARGRQADAIKLLDDLVEKNPEFPSAWVALARIKFNGRSEPALDAVRKRPGNSPAMRVAQAVLMSAQAVPAAQEQFRKLGENIDNIATADLRSLWFGLGEATLRALPAQPTPEAIASLRDIAISFFERAAAADPLDLTSRAILIDLGQAARRQDVTDAALAGIVNVEGPAGPIGTFATVSLRLPSAKGNEAEIADLRTKAKQVEASRPGWGRVYVALARLDEMDGRNDSALENYRKAIDRGDRQEAVIRRVVELYRLRKQDNIAANLLQTLYTEVPLPDDLERFRAIMYLLERDIPASERPTIDRVAPEKSNDYRILMLRGALLTAIRADADALMAYRKAIECNDASPDAWTALVGNLVRLGKIDDAKRALAEAQIKLTSLPASDPVVKGELTVALAGCHELTANPQTAEQMYRQAAQLAPDNLNLNRQLIQYLQRSGKGAEADRLLVAMVNNPAPDLHRWARRYAAISMLARPDPYNHRLEALELVRKNLATTPDDPEDVKAYAMLQTVDPDTRDEGSRR